MAAHEHPPVFRTVQFVAFWLAVALPVLLISLVAFSDPDVWLSLFPWVALVYVAALGVGHGYRR
jgi:hypothetical protein